MSQPPGRRSHPSAFSGRSPWVRRVVALDSGGQVQGDLPCGRLSSTHGRMDHGGANSKPEANTSFDRARSVSFSGQRDRQVCHTRGDLCRKGRDFCQSRRPGPVHSLGDTPCRRRPAGRPGVSRLDGAPGPGPRPVPAGGAGARGALLCGIGSGAGRPRCVIGLNGWHAFAANLVEEFDHEISAGRESMARGNVLGNGMNGFNIWYTLITIVAVMGAILGGALYLVLLERKVSAWV